MSTQWHNSGVLSANRSVDSSCRIGGKSGCKPGVLTLIPTYPASSPSQTGTILLALKVSVGGSGTSIVEYFSCDVDGGVSVPIYWNGEAVFDLVWRASSAPYGDSEIIFPFPSVEYQASWTEGPISSSVPLRYTIPSMALGGGITSSLFSVPRMSANAMLFSDSPSTRTAADGITFYGRSTAAQALSGARFVSGGSANYTNFVPVPGGALFARVTNGAPAVAQNLGIIFGLSL